MKHHFTREYIQDLIIAIDRERELQKEIKLRDFATTEEIKQGLYRPNLFVNMFWFNKINTVFGAQCLGIAYNIGAIGGNSDNATKLMFFTDGREMINLKAVVGDRRFWINRAEIKNDIYGEPLLLRIFFEEETEYINRDTLKKLKEDYLKDRFNLSGIEDFHGHV
jgi:hypothetical protein